MKTGVFGGSFDPPHMSHVLGVLWALETGELEKVLVIPCGQHALGKGLQASFEDRMEMCRRAYARLKDDVEILDIEGEREEVSYTIDTLRALDRERPGAEWRLLIGSDILGETCRWRAWEEIERLAPPLVIPRMTGQTSGEAGEADLRALSSTQLRERLRQGTLPQGLIPGSVLELIWERGLYGCRDG